MWVISQYKKVEVIKTTVIWRAIVSSEEQPYSATDNCSGKKWSQCWNIFQFLKRSQKSRILDKITLFFKSYKIIQKLYILGSLYNLGPLATILWPLLTPDNSASTPYPTKQKLMGKQLICSSNKLSGYLINEEMSIPFLWTSTTYSLPRVQPQTPTTSGPLTSYLINIFSAPTMCQELF